MQMLTDVPTEKAVVYTKFEIINPSSPLKNKIRATTVLLEEKRRRAVFVFSPSSLPSRWATPRRTWETSHGRSFYFISERLERSSAAPVGLFFRADGADVVPYDPAGRNISPYPCWSVFPFSFGIFTKFFIENWQEGHFKPTS